MKSLKITRGMIVGAGLLAGIGIGTAHAQQAQPVNADPTPPPTYDFVQQAGEMKFDGKTMTLTGTDAGVLFFSDRPYRVGGQLSNKDFAGFWEVEDGFKGDPPNAVVSILSETGKVPALVELTSAKTEGSSMVYGVKVLRGELPESAKGVALFIDRSSRPHHHGATSTAPGSVGFEPYGPYCYHAPQDPRCRAWHHPYHPYHPYYPPYYPPYPPYGPYYHPGAYAAGVATGAAIASAARQPTYYYYPIPTGPLPPNCWINSQHTQMVCTVQLQ
jgi:F0F1-type ATP synthase membrane subunit c/vacuolar-type H+-ATPase subunit K